MNSTPIDIVSVCVVIAALLFAPEVAAVVGPYIVIMLASTVGASFALARRERSTRSNALLFFARTSGLSVLLTVGFAAVVSSYRPEVPERVLLAPVALVLGFVGDDWPVVLRWMGRKVAQLVDVIIRSRGNGGGGGNV